MLKIDAKSYLSQGDDVWRLAYERNGGVSGQVFQCRKESFLIAI